MDFESSEVKYLNPRETWVSTSQVITGGTCSEGQCFAQWRMVLLMKQSVRRGIKMINGRLKTHIPRHVCACLYTTIVSMSTDTVIWREEKHAGRIGLSFETQQCGYGVTVLVPEHWPPWLLVPTALSFSTAQGHSPSHFLQPHRTVRK